jgi:hypothetical protein
MPGLSYYGYDYSEHEESAIGLTSIALEMGAIGAGHSMAGGGWIFGRQGGLAARGMHKAGLAVGEAAGLGSAAAVESRFAAALAGARDPSKFGAGVHSRASTTAGAAEKAALKRAGAGRAAAGAAKGRAAAYATEARMMKTMGKRLVTTGKLFGIASVVGLTYDMAKSMMDMGSNFRTTTAEFNKNRQKVYDEDKYSDSRAAFTQRQRALQVIHNSQLGVRSAMGSEASYLHN